MTIVEQLFYLIDEYKADRYTTKDFCNCFLDIYNHQLYSNTIDERTNNYFKSISLLSSRYSWYDEDINNFNDYFIDEMTFRKKMDELVNAYITE